MLNGRGWVNIGAEHKVSWVLGARDQLRVIELGMSVNEDNTCKTAVEGEGSMKAFRSMKYGELVESLDAFYTDPPRRVIPIAAAIALMGEKLMYKWSEADYERWIISSVNLWNQIASRKP